MLCLTRRRNERIRIGNVVVTVVKATGGKVTLGIDAPPEVDVWREYPDGTRQGLPRATDGHSSNEGAS